jgi:hypothetical protein
MPVDGYQGDYIGTSFTFTPEVALAPDDYLHYYPLTNDYKDQVDYPSGNDLTNVGGGCSQDSTGTTFNNALDQLLIGTAIPNADISIVFTWTYVTGSVYSPLCCATNTYHHCLVADNVIGHHNGSWIPSNPAYSLVNGVKYKIIITMSGPNYNLYVNGDNKQSVTNCFSNATYPLKCIGNAPTNANLGAIGLWKDVMIFDRILTSDEIALLSV